MPKAVKPDINIELTCSLCPKNPNFSDVSHLLTHISSKSHLAHRFKLQIRSQSEPEAKETLETFDAWYKRHNLDAMLAERLASKDKKKTTKERKSRVSDASAASSRPTAKKMEQLPVEEVLAATPVFRAPVPRMHLWSTTHPTSPTPARDWGQNNMYSTPTMRRQVPNFTPVEAETPAGDMLNSKSATPWEPDESEELAGTGVYVPKNKQMVEKRVSSDSTTLKGVLWPGMDLFDSATTEMKRMRNQRKDESVLEQMLTTSNIVEPNEIVYDLNGEVHHVRDIFGPLSNENSPIQEPTPKKRKTRRRTVALVDISVNAPRARAQRSKKNPIAETPLKRPLALLRSQGIAPFSFLQNSTPNPLTNVSQNYNPSIEEDEEFRLTVGGMSKKRGLSIFRDAPEVSPGGRTESTLEDHRFDFSNDRAAAQVEASKAANHISPTPAAKQSKVRGFGKENGRSGFSPTMYSHCHPDASQVHPGQMFANPLTAPLPNPLFTLPDSSILAQQTHAVKHLRTHPVASHPYPMAYTGSYHTLHPISRLPGQQQYTTSASNNGQSMQYGV